MSTQEGWLLRPVRAGLCRFESLVDGTLSLCDVADLNEFLDVEAENDRRARVALSKAKGK